MTKSIGLIGLSVRDGVHPEPELGTGEGTPVRHTPVVT